MSDWRFMSSFAKSNWDQQHKMNCIANKCEDHKFVLVVGSYNLIAQREAPIVIGLFLLTHSYWVIFYFLFFIFYFFYVNFNFIYGLAWCIIL
jgi:hypothetical protein